MLLLLGEREVEQGMVKTYHPNHLPRVGVKKRPFAIPRVVFFENLMRCHYCHSEQTRQIGNLAYCHRCGEFVAPSHYTRTPQRQSLRAPLLFLAAALIALFCAVLYVNLESWLF